MVHSYGFESSPNRRASKNHGTGFYLFTDVPELSSWNTKFSLKQRFLKNAYFDFYSTEMSHVTLDYFFPDDFTALGYI